MVSGQDFGIRRRRRRRVKSSIATAIQSILESYYTVLEDHRCHTSPTRELQREGQDKLRKAERKWAGLVNEV
jgi:hypothetical protein